MRVRTVALGGAVAFGASLMILAVSVDTKLLGDNSGYKPVQPIAYSHALHAGELKLDCLFCHTGAEQSRHAGIPPASTCMKCHETILNKAGTKPGVSDPSPEIAKLARAVKEGRPIEWVRIHRLPSHVDFPHSRHVNGGVACQNCHGEIQGMERVEQALALTMGECLTCHRTENQKLQLNGKAPMAPTDCSACHH
ncbi:MAG: cytochrome c3 family protein [Geothrix sp.]|uniref:Cytochrome c3 family protein n=2 Tax=Geothrix TaxID=44675 RepID=A0A936F3W4_9BACT|nr:cytochrome c3 family protein [Holophagaceae bacterium]MBK8573598.1 cytochrome c3 family protein [Candidatus Geothrix odensensis]MBK9797269.1 cytochrome c3 family protein [Candidatus Geothrix skivensis]MBP7617343.1 cytochrome c3 family protein [Geothrix sp.]